VAGWLKPYTFGQSATPATRPGCWSL